MRFAILGDVLGNDRLLDDVLGQLARRDIGPSAVVSMGNLVGRYGDARRCLRMATGFAACLQGPLERELVHRPPGAPASGPRATADESGSGSEHDASDSHLWIDQFDEHDLHSIRQWPPMLLDPPYLFAGSPEQAQKLPESVRLRFIASVGCFWLPGRPDEYLDALRKASEPPQTAWQMDYDDDHFIRREVIVPADGDEWELTLAGAVPAVVHVGSVLGLATDASPSPRRILSAWIVDDRFLRFRCWSQQP
ncbi:MAG: hypothetical protein AB7S36_01675 [Planctomycetota bacterium]